MIRVRQHSVEKMGSTIAEAESKVILERAQVIGQDVRGEDGVGNAFRLTESYVSGLN